MPTVTEATLKLHGYSAVGVCYEGNTRIYTYLTNLILHPGDVVVVPVPNGFKTAVVNRLNSPCPTPDYITYKWIVCKVDFTDYNTLRHIKLVRSKPDPSIAITDNDIPF